MGIHPWIYLEPVTLDGVALAASPADETPVWATVQCQQSGVTDARALQPVTPACARTTKDNTQNMVSKWPLVSTTQSGAQVGEKGHQASCCLSGPLW